MNNHITTGDVANQIAKAVQLLLDWTVQEFSNSGQNRLKKPEPEKEPDDGRPHFTPEILLTAQEAAEALQVDQSTVYNLIRQGLLPSVKFGRSVRVRPKDLADFIEQNRVGQNLIAAK